MSYCVNCGVQLADSEKQCPLCDVAVINPSSPWHEPESRPYPKQVERVMRRVDRKFIVSLASVFLFIPIIIPLITDLLFNDAVTWSGYVIGASICIFFWILFPLLFTVPRPYLCWAADTVVTTGYIALIGYISGDIGWFIPLGLPLCAALSISALLIIAVSSTNLPDLYKTAGYFTVFGVFSVMVDFIINGYITTSDSIHWSFFIVVPCVIFSIVFIILQKRKKLREEIRRRLFY